MRNCALGYDSFEALGEAEFGYKSSHLYRLADAADVEKSLNSPIGEKPIPESQLRPLTQIPEEARQAIWDEANRAAEAAGKEKKMSKNIDALTVLEEVAVSLKESAEQITAKNAYEEGKLMGYYEALSTILSQCEVAGIAKDDIGMNGFSAEDILSPSKQAT